MSVRVRIRGLAHGGEGVGQQDDGLTWFVPGTLPGELVDAEPERRKARWARGRLTQVVEAAPDRVTPPCPVADRCGGCDWQHVDPARQAEHKRMIVAGELRALVPDPQAVRLAAVAGPSLGYRRRARMHYENGPGGLRLGFFGGRSREVVDVTACPVLRPELEHALQRVRRLAEHLPAQGEVLGLSDGQRAVLALPGVRPDEPVLEAAHALLDQRLCGIVLRGGRRSVAVGQHELRLDGGDGLAPMRAHPFVFSQANAAVNRAMVRHVALAARSDGLRVLELYAGAGNLTRALARTAKRVWTLDEDREAKGLLRALAEAEGLPINAKHGSAPSLLASLVARDFRYDVVVVDPPRAGLGKESAAHLARVAEQRVVYVSCDPATLARDLRVLVDGGLRITDVTVFDMMPMTAEVEVVVTLVRGPAEGRR
ncbi:class I SAM-dependent RNA methyltransferase [Paraliomyxa miuraensis]|uniref:class I SAM-dependent RNA methyltransferase n=1 Tax=Paraliomyxa miuraensis TaxID=376150 RepID=UPI00225B7E15|nr:TRAM domain-containing protein [Paraliomyxa miuraensis]MCX4244670.1 RsmD family RNA methyltransferase [Paraliomyxa miuraensis]